MGSFRKNISFDYSIPAAVGRLQKGNIVEQIEGYKEVLAALEKHEAIFAKDYELDIRSSLKSRIKAHQISNDFGIHLDAKRYESGSTFVRLSDYCFIALYGEDISRTISWSDDGKQPENEWLYVISFPTGAYIFGDSYPTATFNDFFVELKSYLPKYSDSNNHNLYFTKDTAKKVHEDFVEILAKYREIVKEEFKASRIKNLEDELAKLTGASSPQPSLNDSTNG